MFYYTQNIRISVLLKRNLNSSKMKKKTLITKVKQIFFENLNQKSVVNPREEPLRIICVYFLVTNAVSPCKLDLKKISLKKKLDLYLNMSCMIWKNPWMLTSHETDQGVGGRFCFSWVNKHNYMYMYVHAAWRSDKGISAADSSVFLHDFELEIPELINDCQLR